jgi:hypothetical protein
MEMIVETSTTTCNVFYISKPYELERVLGYPCHCQPLHHLVNILLNLLILLQAPLLIDTLSHVFSLKIE